MVEQDVVLHPLIIPTVLIPLTAISVLLSSIAVFIAGLFGLQLKAEGPKKLLEVLLKPRILFAALVMNLLILGGIKAYTYFRDRSSFEFFVAWKQARLQQASSDTYTNVAAVCCGQLQASKNKVSGRLSLQPAWQIKLPRGSFSAPTLSGTSLFIGAEDGYIYELAQSDGAIKRRFFMGTSVTPAPLVYEGYLYAGEGVHNTHQAQLRKFDLKSGAYIDRFKAVGHIEGQLYIDTQGTNPLIYVSGGAGGLSAVDPKTMREVWNSNAGHCDSGAVSDMDTVYYGTGREKYVQDKYRSWAVAVHKKDGSTKWQRELPASSWMRPFLQDNWACYVFGEVYFESQIGGVSCFDRETGKKSKIYYHSSPIVSRPLILDSDMIVHDFEGKICRIQLEQMQKVWCQESKKTSYTLSAISYDPQYHVLIQSTRSEGVLVREPETGQEIARWPTDKALPSWSEVIVAADGWYTVDTKGTVTKLSISVQNANEKKQ